MELRKLQSTGGGSTFIISLPHGWVKQMGLKPHDYIGIIRKEDNTLILTPHPKKAESGVVSEIQTADKDADLIVREVVAHYIDGADYILVHGVISRDIRSKVANLASNFLVGVEVVNENDREISLQCIIDDAEMPVRRVFKRNINLLNWMYDEAINAVLSGDKSLCDEVIKRDNDVDRLTILATRQLTKALKDPTFAQKLGINQSDVQDYRSVIRDLEGIADACLKIAFFAQQTSEHELPVEFQKNLSKLTEEIKSAYTKSFRAFDVDDKTQANNVLNKVNELERVYLPALTKEFFVSGAEEGHVEDLIPMSAIMQYLMLILHTVKGICEITINTAARKESRTA